MEEIIKKYELNDLALQMVGAKQMSSQSPERELLRNLLPINSAFGYYHNDTFTWEDPRDGKVYSESFHNGDEDGRLGAIKKINERIGEYNIFLEKLQEKEGIEKTFELKYFPQDESWMWGLHFVMSQPTIKQKNRYGQDQDHFGILQINNEFCYTRGLQLEMEDYVPRFNKMMYDYINALCPNNKHVVETHVLYNAIIEYENWFMMHGNVIDKTVSLVEDVKRETDNPVAQSFDPNQELRAAHNIILNQREKIKQYKNSAEHRIKELIGTDKLDDLVDSTRFKSSGKINWKKSATLLGCSDKKAKSLIEDHAPYLLRDDEMGYLE